ncbi:26S proteasome non-ATPase regulatory subunit 9-like [Convolutriloba macropyga]|uniref:26S proteasome non-ATPase regulatory subunit 9-like n=1 Tax=Convolutriloba macropyga TaxID=536237 RepID=UPI003F52767C
MQLDEERRNIELEVAQLNEILNTDIGVGMHGPLIDSEDYPKSDIDVHLARISRHRVACLQTDHSHIMTQIQYKLHQLHSITRDSEASNTEGAASESSNTAHGDLDLDPRGRTGERID